MCGPAPIIAGIGVAVQAGSAIAGSAAQNKAAEANAEAARKAMLESFTDIGLLEQEVGDQAAVSIFQAERRARTTQALERVAAGEAGVEGTSAEAVLRDIERQAAEFKVGTERQTKRQIAQLQREKVSGRTIAQNRIAQVPRSNPLLVGLQIGGAAIGGATTILNQRTTVSTNPGSGG